MKYIKSILKKPATAVIFFGSILTLIGVFIGGFFDLNIAKLPIKATQTAQAIITSSPIPSPVSASPPTGDSISVGGDVENSTIIQSGGGDINLAPTNPAFDEVLDSVEIEGTDRNVLVAYNQKGFPIWRERFNTRISNVEIGDIDNDGTREVLFGLQTPGDNPGVIISFTESGEFFDEIDLWKQPIYYGGAKEDCNIIDFEIVDLTSDGKKEIVVISNDIYWYASKLSVLEYSQGYFQVIAEYWNPGLLYTLEVEDLDLDGIYEVFVTGVNNDLQSMIPLGGNVHIAFMLRGDRIEGEAPPWFGNSKRGTEIWYGYVTPRETRVETVMFEDANNDGALDIHLPLSDACSYYLNILGDVIGYGRGTSCKSESEFVFVP